MEKVIKSIETSRRLVSVKNKIRIACYFDANGFLLNKFLHSGNYYEKEILFMIRNSVSLSFIKRYLGIGSSDYIINIAKLNGCQSYILSSFTENIVARCFSKNQIIRSAEDFNYLCPMCFEPLDITDINCLTGHHILPFSCGGLTKKENCLPLHTRCHFDDFKLLHSALFTSNNLIYSARYFNEIKNKLNKYRSGMDYIIRKLHTNN